VAEETREQEERGAFRERVVAESDGVKVVKKGPKANRFPYEEERKKAKQEAEGGG
jgi:hypothetical protein